MIVRLMGEGQYTIDDDSYAKLNQLDDRAQEALDRGDENELDRYLDEMASLVRRAGEKLPPDDLSTSDALVPPSDMSLEEARKLFSDQGLIPDIPS